MHGIDISVVGISVLTATLMWGWSGCRLQSAEEPGSEDNQEPANPAVVIEVRRGGGMEKEPHAVWIRVFDDGRVYRDAVERQVEPERVAGLMERIIATELFDTDQDAFDRQLIDAGEKDKSLRGGSGIYTITIGSEDGARSLRLNRPELYETSTVPAAQKFSEVLKLITDLDSSS